MPPPHLRGGVCPAAPFVALARLGQIHSRPQRRLGRVFQHSAPHSDLLNRPRREVFFVMARLCEVAELRPCAAWRVRHDGGSSWPFSSVSIHVPRIHAGHCFVDRISASEQRRHQQRTRHRCRLAFAFILIFHIRFICCQRQDCCRSGLGIGVLLVLSGRLHYRLALDTY